MSDLTRDLVVVAVAGLSIGVGIVLSVVAAQVLRRWIDPPNGGHRR